MTIRTLRNRTMGLKVVGVALAGLTMAACSHDAPERTAEVLAPVSVTVTPAWASAADHSFTARVEAEQAAEVATRMSGTLTNVAVQVGQRVAAGDLLARLDDADVRARITSAEAQVALAEQTHGRIVRLAADGAASQQELDQITAQLAAARAGLTEAQAQAAYVEVRAPFAGVVTARMADPGDLALPGHPIVVVEGQGARKVVADLPADQLGQVAAGDPVSLHRDGAAIEGTVRRVSPSLDTRSRRFRVEVTSVDALPWPAGEVVTLSFSGEGTGTRWIPSDAVVRRGQLAGVFAVENDSLRLRWLRLGREVEGRVEVLAGPAGEMNVVRRPAADLRDGAPVSSANVERVMSRSDAAAETEEAR